MDSNLPAKAKVIGDLMERGSFMHRNDLLLEAVDYQAEHDYRNNAAPSGRTQISGSLERAVEELVEDGVLQQLDSGELLEEVIRSGRYVNDEFPEMKVSELEDADEGGYCVAIGPRIPFFIVENFSELIEICEEHDFSELRDYCFEIITAHEIAVPGSDRIVARDDNSSAFSDIDVELDSLERRLLSDNSAAKALADDRDVAISEVGVLRRFIASAKIRASVFVALSKKTLGWIADKCAGAAVGEVAKHVLLQILRLFG